jgi:hypothetical protein
MFSFKAVRAGGFCRMSLQELVVLMEGKTSDAVDQRRLRSYFANMLQGLKAEHFCASACQVRLQNTLDRLQRAGAVTWSCFHSELNFVLESVAERDHYLRPQQLDCETECLAVTFQQGTDRAMMEWTGKWVEPRQLTLAIESGKAIQTATVGPPGKAVWLTPVVGEVKEILDEARIADRAELANRVRMLIGASHWEVPNDILGFVTKQPIADLKFTRDVACGDPKSGHPVGSTVIEARLHKHFRFWPSPSTVSDTYGRSFHLDPEIRKKKAPNLDFGVREAIRAPLQLSEFSECIYIGRTDPLLTDAEPSEEYLKMIEASRTAHELLTDLVSNLLKACI